MVRYGKGGKTPTFLRSFAAPLMRSYDLWLVWGIHFSVRITPPPPHATNCDFKPNTIYKRRRGLLANTGMGELGGESFICFNGLRKSKKSSGSSGAKHRVSLQNGQLQTRQGWGGRPLGSVPGRGLVGPTGWTACRL